MTRRAAFLLFGRRQQSSRWIFVGAAFFLVILAFAGFRHSTSTWYAFLATLCILQAVYPTLAGWCFVFVLFLFAAYTYSFLVVGDVIRIWRGSDPLQLFLDPMKTAVTLLQFAMVIFVVIRLPFVRPRLLPTPNAA